jgi:hypothetical protein
MTQQQLDELSDADFEIYWHTGHDLTWCALCGAAVFPCEGYQLRLSAWTAVDEHGNERERPYCDRLCALPYAPHLTALLLEGWNATRGERTSA